jgi:phage/plasmid primase-like uncharacterized protein
MLDFTDADPHLLRQDDKPRKLTFSQIKEAIEGRERELLGALRITPPAPGKRIRCPLPYHEDKNPSWRWDASDGCYHCTCSHGDILDLIQQMGHASKASEAAAWAADALGLHDAQPRRPAPQPAEAPADEPKDYTQSVLNIVRRCEPLAGTPAEAYLKIRKITVKPSADLMYCGKVRDSGSGLDFPALIGLVRDKAGEFMNAIHRTYLLHDGSGKASVGKKALNPFGGGSIRLLPLDDRGVLGIAEGIETALAAAQIFWVPVWSAISAGNLASWQWPDGLKEIIIFADSKKPGKPGEEIQKSIDALYERVIATGVVCRIQYPLCGDDFNDDLAKGKKAEDYRATEKQPVGWTYDNFLAYLPMNKFICIDTRDLWPAESVNSQLPWKRVGKVDVPPSRWLSKHQAVQQMTWAPGRPLIIEDKVISEGGFIDRPDSRILNLYRPPIVKTGNAADVKPWLDHIERVYPDEVQELVAWFAHRVQRPEEKINHALVLGGPQGTGKDTILEPVKYAVGHWNCTEISPAQMLGRFNGYLRSVILRISEARDLGEVDRYTFYDHCKTLMAAPPDVLRCDEKNMREYSVPNVCGVIITTNYKSDGLYLSPDDRRHFVAWAEILRDTFEPDYWSRLYSWYGRGGLRNVAAYLAAYDLSNFDAKAPPRQTPAFRDIADANRAPEDSELADVLDSLGRPAAIRLEQIASLAPKDLAEWLRDRKNRRKIPHRMESAGYVATRNPGDKHDGQWKIGNKRHTVYVQSQLSLRDRIEAAAQHVEEVNR